MHFSWTQLIVWIIIGFAGGTLAGLVIKWTPKGFGFPTNLGLGMAGALLGGFLFQLFDILPSLDKISISLRDVVAALCGSLLVLLVLWLRKQFWPS
jgi:uncharacterized membrane protein YeaQ/YmgE (transglycosylase-associated protein family)